MENWVVFSQAVEGMQRAMGARFEPADLSRLASAGIDFNKPLLPAYPLKVWHELVRVCGARLAPDAPEDEQTFAIGCRFLEGYVETMMGKAVLTMARVVGPARTLARLTRQFRSANNFADTKLVERTPNEFELWVNYVKFPGWYRGILLTGLTYAGAKGVQVECLKQEGDTATFRIRWE